MKDLRANTRSGTGWLANPATPAEAELRQALDQAAAREADEVALRRVWARLAENPALVPSPQAELREKLEEGRGRRVRWPWIVVASLAGATATLAFMLVESQSEFRAGKAGETVVAGPAGDGTNGVKDDSTDQRSTLVAPATVRTGFGETLNLSLRGGTHVTVTSESTLVLDRNDQPAVSAGEVQFNVPRQPSGEPFTVAAGAYKVVVLGTRFRVRVSQSNAAVGVDEGTVEIWTDHRVAVLTAGESWVSSASSAATGALPSGGAAGSGVAGGDKSAIGSSPAGHARQTARAAGGRAGSRPSGRGITPPAKVNPPRVLALASPSVTVTGPAPTVEARRPGHAAAALPTTSRPGAPVSKETSVAGATADPPAPVTASPIAPTVAPPAPAVEAQPLAIQARAARAAGDATRALGLYRTLAQRGGAAGENAEYEIGRVLRDGLNQPREALSAWRSYRAQHPRGLLRVETDISVIETLVALGDKPAAVAEASDFIRRYPDSERRAEVARLAGDLLRERGACAEAIGVYEVALGSAHVRRDVSDGASFHRAVCLFRGGSSDGGKALQGYLAAFPGGRYRDEAQRLLDRAESPGGANLLPR